MPLLICSLKLPDVDIRTNSINTLSAMSGKQATSEILAQHASTIIDSMLNIGLDSLGSSTVINFPLLPHYSFIDVLKQHLRIAALQYLGLLPSLLNYSVLHPHKARVLWGLAKSLDDVKRSVRREGVNTRCVTVISFTLLSLQMILELNGMFIPIFVILHIKTIVGQDAVDNVI